MKRSTRLALACACVLLVVSFAVAQQVPQPVTRLGNWLEVGNDVFMHIIGTADIRYRAVHNYDFESRIRDRVVGRDPDNSASQEGDSDLSYAELRFGMEARYQKSLMMQVLFEHQQVFDGQLVDDRSNASNPGGTDAFGRPASTENPGFHIERYWIDYEFPGTPLHIRVGADLWRMDQAGLLGDDDPRFAVYGSFGSFDFTAAAVIQSEAQRIGLENDNDFVYYTLSLGYNFKPHRVQLDAAYFRERFNGARTGGVIVGGVATPLNPRLGEEHDSVLISGSWTGNIGPFRGIVQGNGVVGRAQGNSPLVGGTNRKYNIAAWGVVAYGEVDLNVIRPFAGIVYGSGDNNPGDRTLTGFMTLPQREITLMTNTSFFAHLETSPAFGTRDYACPGRLNGLPAATQAHFGGNAASGGAECGHTVGNPFNDRIGNDLHLGINSTYSNPGVVLIPVGFRLFPVKGHELTAWYMYRAWVEPRLIEISLNAPRGSIAKTQYHEVGGFWQWTLNPHFDIRLAGNIGIPGEGYKDFAQFVNCNTNGPNGVGPFRACEGNDLALWGEARFRARF